MKKSIHFVVVGILLSISAAAQFNVGIQVGVTVPTAGVALPGFIEIEKNGTQKVLVATLGAGTNFNGELGYTITQNVSVNLGFGYFKGFKAGFKQYMDTDPAAGFQNNGAMLDVSLGSSFTHVTPNILITTNAPAEKTKPFVRFGVITGSGKASITTTVTGLSGKNVDEFSGGLSVGFLGGIGLQKKVSQKMSFLIELTTKTITTYPKILSNTQTFEGLERTPDIHFKKEISTTSAPTDQLTTALPYSSLGLNIGVVVNLGGS